jgi:erythronate-4-phosphate dehydrogenase
MIYNAFCNYFGTKPKFTAQNFLPKPKLPEISLKNEKNPLLFAVNSLYDIRKDDANLREIKNEPADKRGSYFDGLRKNYPVRREFVNTKILGADEKLKKVFAGLGFQTK